MLPCASVASVESPRSSYSPCACRSKFAALKSSLSSFHVTRRERLCQCSSLRSRLRRLTHHCMQHDRQHRARVYVCVQGRNGERKHSSGYDTRHGMWPPSSHGALAFDRHNSHGVERAALRPSKPSPIVCAAATPRAPAASHAIGSYPPTRDDESVRKCCAVWTVRMEVSGRVATVQAAVLYETREAVARAHARTV